MRQSNFKEIIFRGILFLILMVFVLSACGGEPLFPTAQPWTATPSPTATCVPNIDLSTPIGWDPSSRLIIILFDPTTNNGESLEYLDGGNAQSITEFVIRMIPAIAQAGDQISVFQLGFRQYQNARFLRVYSYTELPQLYDTPIAQQTLTPIVEVAKTLTGLEIIQADNEARKTQAAHAGTATAIFAEDNCKKEVWNKTAGLTATAWAQTKVAEVSTISANAEVAATAVAGNNNVTETPYARNVVYEGLYHATVDIESDCAKYDECILLIIDDLNTWTNTNLGDFDINLTGIDLVYSIMPNCKDINDPDCTKLQQFWDSEFSLFGAHSTMYVNGDRAEINLLDTIGR